MADKKLTRGFIGFKVFRNFTFYAGIMQLYLVSQGISFEMIMLAYGIQSVTMMLFEIATGIFADRFGRRLSLIAGVAIRALGIMLLFAWAEPLGVIVGFILVSLGLAFISGSDSALIFDATQKNPQSGSYRRLESLGYLVELGTYGAAAALGSIIAELTSLWVPVVMSALLSPIAILFALMLPSDRHERRTASLPRNPLLQFLRVMGVVIRHPPLRAAALAFIVFYALVDAGTILYQPALADHGVATIWFGVGVAVMVVVDMAGVWAGNRTPLALLSRGKSVLLVSTIFGGFIFACLAAYWVAPSFAIVLLIGGFLLHAFGDGLQYPLVRIWANESFEGVERATMMSVLASAGLLLIGAMHAINGVLIGIGGTQLAFVCVLAIWAAGSIGCWQALRRIKTTSANQN